LQNWFACSASDSVPRSELCSPCAATACGYSREQRAGRDPGAAGQRIRTVGESAGAGGPRHHGRGFGRQDTAAVATTWRRARL
jgi:hypothetical protein